MINFGSLQLFNFDRALASKQASADLYCEEYLTQLISAQIPGVSELTHTWTIANRKCRERTKDKYCDPCSVGSVNDPLPLKYGDLYCEKPDHKKDYLICFDATPKRNQLLCKPGYGWNTGTKMPCKLEDHKGNKDCVETGGWVKQSKWPECLQSARDYQSAHAFPSDGT